MTDLSHSQQTQTAPRGFRPILRKLGPGLIISGSIVGSGELIATTTLGAEVGFVALWLIIVSCGIKVVVQEELGRYVVSSGETALQGLNRVPGPRWRVSWVVWCWWIMTLGVIIQGGGIAGGVGQVFHLFVPQISGTAWALVAAVSVMALLFRGHYGRVEKICVGMVVSFTFVTIACAVLLGWTPFAPTTEDFLSGLRLGLPEGGIAVAFAAFGITGVGATELIMYPYWCLEKGYARFVGPREEGAAWEGRARGWIRVMQADVLMAMVVYTTATVAFYILGAAVLHGMGTVPAGYGMVSTLSNMYTSTLGPWAFYLFLLGAFFVLYSTLFAGVASSSRVITDFLRLVGVARIENESQLLFWRRVVIVVVPTLYVVLYGFVAQPVFMVIIGGIFQACMLPVISFSAIYLRYRHTDRAIRPSLTVDVLLWVCSTVMLLFAVYYVAKRLGFGA